MNSKKSVLFRILAFTKPYLFYLVSSMLLAAVSVGLTLYAPILTGNAIDEIIEKNRVDFPRIFKILIVFGVVVLITSLAQWLMNL